MAKNKLQINLDDDTYSIIEKLKPRSIKLFVSIAIERFTESDESKLFFKNKKESEEKITKIPKENNEVQKKSPLEEWE